jgi:hypothetical protein
MWQETRGWDEGQQSCAKRGPIQEVGGDGADALDIGRRAPCEPKHPPAASAEATGEITSTMPLAPTTSALFVIAVTFG